MPVESLLSELVESLLSELGQLITVENLAFSDKNPVLYHNIFA